jgi:hypothetical protein
MEKRTRKFEYIFNDITDEYYEALKTIDCKYHINGFNGAELHGFIYFNYTKTENAAKKYLNSAILKFANKPNDIYLKISRLNKIWENKPFNDIKTQINSKVQKKKEIILDIEKTIDIDNLKKAELLQITKTLLKDNNIFKKMFLHQTQVTNKILENQTKLIESNITNTMTNAMTNSMNNSNNSTDNSKNKKITNINVFLNTECKDAITLKDFINELVIEDEDLMCLKDHGYIESVSRLLNKALVGYDLYKRPIHCSDIKREVMHVKDQEGWKKETPTGESVNLDKAFSRLSQLQCKKMVNYYQDVEEPNMDEKASIMFRIAESSNEENCKKKIIKKIIENIKL